LLICGRCRDADAKDIDAQEQAHKIEELEDSLQDYEGTINQFRDLVLQLQS
jgi:dynactin 1